MSWSEDYLYFDYALGVIDDEDILNKIKSIDFYKTNFDISYIEINLLNLEEWETFKGRKENLQQIYEKKQIAIEKNMIMNQNISMVKEIQK